MSDSMKIKVMVKSKMVGSESSREIEIQRCKLEGLSENEINLYIETYAQDAMFDMIEWDYEIIEE